MYFSLVSIWWTAARVHGRPRSVRRLRALRSAAISASRLPSRVNCSYIRRTTSHLLLGTGNQDHPIGLQALMLAAREHAFALAALVDEHPAQAVARRPALAVAEFDQPALAP